MFNNLLSPILADSVSILFAAWFGAILCAASVGCVLIAIPIDKSLEMKIAQQVQYSALSTQDTDVKINNISYVTTTNTSTTNPINSEACAKSNNNGEHLLNNSKHYYHYYKSPTTTPTTTTYRFVFRDRLHC